MGKKIVLDTNIFISALGWGGKPHQIFKRCIAKEFILFLSPDIFKEINRVLHYPKFVFSEEDISEFLGQILEIGNFVTANEKITVIKDDPSDNMFLECALSAKAEYIVSGNIHLKKLKEFRGIKIVTATDFLEKVQKIGK